MTRVMARKDLGVTRVAALRGMRIGNQSGSSTGNTFVGIIAPRAGLRKGDYREINLSVNEMVPHRGAGANLAAGPAHTVHARGDR
jgi:ABC-type nitrate/sulfonate/bicarbonate transport system substrate-binding protein